MPGDCAWLESRDWVAEERTTPRYSPFDIRSSGWWPEYSQSIEFALGAGVSERHLFNLLHAAVLRSNKEIERFDEGERTGKDPAQTP